MKTIKVIDLLNKIVNGEEVPNKIKYADYIFEWTGLNYYCNQFDVFLEKRICIEDLCYPVEIIEEDKEIENIPSWTAGIGRVDESNIEKYIHLLFEQQNQLFHKMRELIEVANELKKGK